MIKKPQRWGFMNQVTKKGLPRRVSCFCPSQSPNICFVDKAAKAKKWLPQTLQEHKFPEKLNGGKFLKSRKVSVTESIFKREKHQPSPHSYSTLHLKQRRILGALNL